MSDPSALPLIDLSEGLRLTGGGKTLYVRLLSRFPADPSTVRLEDALKGGDVRAAFMNAHTLKGLSAQLALPAIHAQAAHLCDLLRAEDSSALSAAREGLPALLCIHQDTIDAIETLCREAPRNP